MPIGNVSGFEMTTLGTLSSAGVTAADETSGANLTFQLVVSGVSGSVVMRFEGSIDGVSYGDLNDGADITITANGTTLYGLSSFPVRFVRCRFVSGTGTVVCSVGCQ